MTIEQAPQAPQAESKPASPAAPAPAPEKTSAEKPAEKRPVQSTILGSAPAESEAAPAAGEAKAQEPGADQEWAPKLPEGWTAEDPLVKGFMPLAKELKLPPDQAQKLVDLYVGRQQELVEQAQALRQKTRAEWLQTLKQDPELGGAQFEAKKKVAQQAMAKFGDAELRKVFDETELGDFPALVRCFYRVGKTLQSDRIAGTTQPQAPAPAPKKPWELLYNHSNVKKGK